MVCVWEEYPYPTSRVSTSHRTPTCHSWPIGKSPSASPEDHASLVFDVRSQSPLSRRTAPEWCVTFAWGTVGDIIRPSDTPVWAPNGTGLPCMTD